jgi:Zn-dependent protease
LLDLNLAALLIPFLVLLFSLTVHESAHAWTADRLGDSTARSLGRISLNPVVHIDPIGTLLLPIVAFSTGAPIIGWAKPVPVNILRLKNYRRDFLFIAAAGPASNLLLALLASLALRLLAGPPGAADQHVVVAPLVTAAAMMFQINLLLAVFNMIPVPPLDGGNVLAGLLPHHLADAFDRLRPYGFLILYGLLLTGTLGYIIGPPYFFLSWLLRL